MDQREIIANGIDDLQAKGLLGRLAARSGENYIFSCPFPDNHDGKTEQKTPSFGVHAEEGMWHCFSCKAGGKSFKFLYAALLDVSTDMAEEMLGTPQIPFAQIRAAIESLGKMKDEGYPSPKAPYPEKTDPATNAAALRYLNKRNIPESVWRAAGVSYYGGQYMPVFEDAEFSGTRGNRIIIPVEYGGEVVGYSGRSLNENDERKYYRPINNVTSCVFNPMRVTPENSKIVYVVEGEFDALACAREKLPAVATFSANVTAQQNKFLSQFKDVVFLYDPDAAGHAGVVRTMMLYGGFLSPKVLWLPQGKDPGNMPEGWGDTIRQVMKNYKRPDAVMSKLRRNLENLNV